MAAPLAILLLGLLLLAGRLAQAAMTRLPGMGRWLILPASVIGGGIGLCAGPEVAGRLGTEAFFAEDLYEGVFEVWRHLPGLLVAVIFATLFLGKPIPGPRKIWEMAAPQATFGQTVAWGQFVIGLLLVLLILTPVFDTNPLAGALIEIGFEGGHGTAAGLGPTFDELEFQEGRDLAMGLATVGVIMAVLLGGVFVRRHAPAEDEAASAEVTKEQDRGSDDRPETEDALLHDENEPAILEPLALQIGLISLAIGLGWLGQQGLILLETSTWGGDDGIDLVRLVPLFPFAMLGGVAMQILADRIGAGPWISAELMGRVRGVTLDATIAAAIATLALGVLGEHWPVLLVLGLAGIAWNVAALVYLAPRIIHRNSFERAIGDFGQSMGMTATGLLLMRMADPRNRSKAIQSFGYKQLLFEPFVGGGLATAMSLPVIHALGPLPALLISGALLAAWLLFAWFMYIRHFDGRAEKNRSMCPTRGVGDRS